jgi:hypothetical protein
VYVPASLSFVTGGWEKQMILQGIRYCDNCNLAIPDGQKDRVQFEDQDYHNSCWRKLLDKKFALRRDIASAVRWSQRPEAN